MRSQGSAQIHRSMAPNSHYVRCPSAKPIGVTWSPEPKVESDRRFPITMPEQNLTPEILTAALQGLEAQRARLDAQIADVQRMLGARPQKPAPAAAPKPKRKMSAAGRRRMAEAAKKRWAAQRHKAEAATKAKETTAAAKTPRPKRKISAAGRKRMVEGSQKRWAEYRRRKAEAAQ